MVFCRGAKYCSVEKIRHTVVDLFTGAHRTRLILTTDPSHCEIKPTKNKPANIVYLSESRNGAMLQSYGSAVPFGGDGASAVQDQSEQGDMGSAC